MRRSAWMTPVALVGAAALLLTGCANGSAGDAGSAAASPEPSTAPELSGTSWVLSSYGDASGSQVDSVATGTVNFGANLALSGSTGCNQFAGTYTQSGWELTLNPGATTMMGCPGAVGDQETAVLAAMPKVTTFALQGSDLALADSQGSVLLVYTPGLDSIEGTSWQAASINNGKGGVESSAATEAVTASFGTDGTLNGNGGCNTYSSPYTLSGKDGLAIGPVASTRMVCDDAANSVEQQYFAALDATASYQIDGTTLTLRDSDGSTQVVYRLTDQ